MKAAILLILLTFSITGCTSNSDKPQPKQAQQHKAQHSETKCRKILADFFEEYDAIIRARDIDKLEDYIDDGSRRWGMNKPGIYKRVRNNFGVIQKYDVTIKQCKTIDNDTILWEGYADWGIGITQHSMGTGLIRSNGKWRMRVIEYRP